MLFGGLSAITYHCQFCMCAMFVGIWAYVDGLYFKHILKFPGGVGGWGMHVMKERMWMF